eukprot:TRINITY_DN6091_c0_g1_i2.p2 TRINITY_DN6091_c0_g1~~TRINITY_DN6091_c0_g1_i2.p2  ORF type:complete len:436 (-),score=38.01 TRINITY_DN6091_c0_g1_i2:256-1563(-)
METALMPEPWPMCHSLMILATFFLSDITFDSNKAIATGTNGGQGGALFAFGDVNVSGAVIFVNNSINSNATVPVPIIGGAVYLVTASLKGDTTGVQYIGNSICNLPLVPGLVYCRHHTSPATSPSPKLHAPVIVEVPVDNPAATLYLYRTNNTHTSHNETVVTSFGDFVSPSQTVAWPQTWISTNTTTDISVIPTGDTMQSTLSALLSSNVSVSVTTVFDPNNDVSINLPGYEYTLPSNTLKFALSMQATAHSAGMLATNWSYCFFSSEQLGSYSTAYTTDYTSGSKASIYTFHRINPGCYSSLQLSVEMYGYIDGVLEAIPHQPPTVARVNRSDATGISACVVWRFPSWRQSLLYDPDLAVLVNPDQPQPTTREQSPSSSIDLMAVVIPVVVAGTLAIVCILAVVVIVSMLAIMKYRRQKRLAKLHQGLKAVGI